MKGNLELAVTAAKKAGKLLHELMPTGHGLNVAERSQLMNEADRKVHDVIYQAFPDHAYISVFTENQTYFEQGALWVIDPIVGLGNFGHGDPHFAISIALNVDDTTQLGVIYNPVFDELFTTIIGEGAFLNGSQIHVSKTDKLKDALLSTRFPYDMHEEGKETGLNLFNELIQKAEGVLNQGTATLDLAYVAAGQHDGFWAFRMNPWDLTAAVLLIEEAGGKVSTLSGHSHFTESTEILATNTKLHAEMIDTISRAHKKITE